MPLVVGFRILVRLIVSFRLPSLFRTYDIIFLKTEKRFETVVLE